MAAAVPGLRLYSDLTNGDLNAAIARHWGVRPENILCGNGSDENLLLALRAFCDESTPLAFADVTYSFYTVLCDLLHIPQHIIPLEADLTIDLKKYCGLHETIVIANPNAPTSLLAPVDAIEEAENEPRQHRHCGRDLRRVRACRVVLSAAFGKI